MIPLSALIQQPPYFHPDIHLINGVRQLITFRSILNRHIHSIRLKWMECPAAALVEFTKELYELETVGVYISSQQIDRKVQRMSHNKNKNKYDRSHDSVSCHARHLVNYRGDNSGSKSQRQQT